MLKVYREEIASQQQMNGVTECESIIVEKVHGEK